jgi:hypothetical protein
LEWTVLNDWSNYLYKVNNGEGFSNLLYADTWQPSRGNECIRVFPTELLNPPMALVTLFLKCIVKITPWFFLQQKPKCIRRNNVAVLIIDYSFDYSLTIIDLPSERSRSVVRESCVVSGYPSRNVFFLLVSRWQK